VTATHSHASSAVIHGSRAASLIPTMRAASSSATRQRPLPLDHPLARLRDTAMGVVLHTGVIGDLVISVEGDAPLGTAQAMLRDIVNIAAGRR